MLSQQPFNRSSNGRFLKGASGNPRGRPHGSTGHAAELWRLEEGALDLASNVTDIMGEAARLALADVGHPELVPLFEAITSTTKDAIKCGGIGPSSLAVLRGWFNDHQESGHGSEFFVHAGLPVDCSWSDFLDNYKTRGRIDLARHIQDLVSFPPIARRIHELKGQTPDDPC